MAKRKVSLRNSKRFSSNRSSPYNSAVLEPNSSILDEERTSWWNDLEEDSPLRYSLIRNNGNETTRQLSQNSETEISENISQWWKYLSSDNESNKNFNINRVAVKAHHNVIASSTSESENEVVTKAKRINLKSLRRKTEGNIFLNVLNNNDIGTNEVVPLKSKIQERYSGRDSSNNEISQIKLHENIEDSLNLHLNTIRLRPNIFKKKRINKVEDRNVFQDALTEDSILDSSANKTSVLKKKFLKNLTYQNIDINKDHIDGQREGSMKLSQELSLDNEIGPSNVSTFRNQNAVLQNNIISDIDEAEHSNDKSEKLDRERMKSSFLQRAQKSIGKNVSIALADDEDISALNGVSKKQSSNISLEKKKHNVEEDTSNSSLNNDEIRKSSVKFSKSKIKYSHNKSLNENLQKESFEQNNMTREQILRILANSSSDEETRLTRNSSKIRSKTSKSAHERVHEVTNDDNLEDNINEEQHSSTLIKQLSNSSPGKTTRLTRNSSRIQSERSTLTSKRAHEIINDDNLEYDINEEQDSSTLNKKLSKSSSGKEIHLTRNSSKTRFETLKSAHKRVHEVTNDDNLEDNINEEQHSSTLIKQLSNSSPGKTTRLTRNSSRIQSERSTLTSKRAHEIINDNNLEYDINKEQDSSILEKKLSSSDKEIRLTRNSFRNRHKTSDFMSGTIQPSTHSANGNVDIENDNVSRISEINIDDSLPITSSTRISSTQIKGSIKNHKNANLLINKDVPMTQMVQQKSKEISICITKLNSPKKLRTIHDFFKVKQSSTTVVEPSTSNNNLAPTSAFNKKMEKIKMELEKTNQKNHEVAATDKKKNELKVRNANSISTAVKQRAKKKSIKLTKEVNKAFLVNGKKYKAPKLPHPKYWVTDHLYKFLWKCMEEKYKFATRIKSEKFVQELADIVSFICNSKKYDNYKVELKALMKEMARLNIIKTRKDFYNFCWDFMPYEFRVKAVPILLPNNKRTIPYDPKTLYTSLLDDDHSDDSNYDTTE